MNTYISKYSNSLYVVTILRFNQLLGFIKLELNSSPYENMMGIAILGNIFFFKKVFGN